MLLWVSVIWRRVTKENETIPMCRDKQSKMTPSPVQEKLEDASQEFTCYRAMEDGENVVGRKRAGENVTP